MLAVDSMDVLSQIAERVELSKSNCFFIPWPEMELEVVAVETIGSATSAKVFTQCAECLSDSSGRILFHPGSSAVWLTIKNARYDQFRSNWNASDSVVWMTKIWSSPNLEALKSIGQDICMRPSSMINSLGGKHWIVRLARFVNELPGELFLTPLTFDYDDQYEGATCLVHGIDEKPEVLLASILQSVRGIYTCCIHSLEGCEGAWKGRYALRLSPSIVEIENFLD